jgi:hypothetical protein
MKNVRRVAVAFFACYVLLLGFLWGVMHRPISFGQVMKYVPDPAFIFIPFKQLWFSARGGSLKVGEPAPDFNLPTTDKKSFVRLSSLHGQKPVVLIFGSYS